MSISIRWIRLKVTNGSMLVYNPNTYVKVRVRVTQSDIDTYGCNAVPRALQRYFRYARMELRCIGPYAVNEFFLWPTMKYPFEITSKIGNELINDYFSGKLNRPFSFTLDVPAHFIKRR